MALRDARPWWSRWLVVLRRWLQRSSVAALPAPRAPLPPPGSEAFMRDALGEVSVSDARTDAWVRLLGANLQFPQPRFGNIAAPTTAREAVEALSALDADVRAAIDRAESLGGDGAEPDWFVLFADRMLPLAAWFAGVGLHEGTATPDWLRNLAPRVRLVPGAGKALDWLDERVARLSEHNAGTLAAYFVLLKVHLEASLKLPGAEVTFDFPNVGARIADLDPPPAHGSPTSGAVVRVLCPSITVRLPATESAQARVLARGAHVRA